MKSFSEYREEPNEIRVKMGGESMSDNEADLNAWREELEDSRIKSLKTNALYVDASPSGAGKSTANLKAIQRANSSITLLSTHDQCREYVKMARQHGIDNIASYPRLNKATCQIYDVAELATQSGIVVGEAICPECPYFKSCEFQRRRELARRARHVVTTHARVAASGFTAAAAERDYVSIQGDPINLLRPALSVRSAKDFGTVQTIATGMQEIAARMGDAEKVAFARKLYEAAGRLSDVLFEAALEEPDTPRVLPVPIPEKTPRPARLDKVLFEAVKAAPRLRSRNVLRLTVAYACGELDQLCLFLAGKPVPRLKRLLGPCLIGTTRNDPPIDATVWFELANGDSKLFAEITRRQVIDRTPQGSLPFRTSCRQIRALDIKNSTRAGKVRAVVRGLIAANPRAVKIGIIILQRHVKCHGALKPSR